MTIFRSERPRRPQFRAVPLLLAMAGFVLVPSAAAHAMQATDEPAAPGGISVRVDFDGAQLAETCRSAEDDPHQDLTNLLCAGYVIGVRDSFNFIHDISGAPGRFCADRSVTRGEYIDAFKEYFAQNPRMADLPAVGVILLAFEWKFPCPQGAAD